jgi:transcriptional regulator with XRE-family HTH domain
MMDSIGERLKLLRRKLGLTQVKFAEKLGRSKRSIQEWESGRNEPSERVLRLIEQTFSVNPEWLREGKGEMFLPKKKELTGDPFEIAAEAVIDAIMEKKDIKLPPTKKRKLVKKLAELMKQIGEKEAIDLIDLAV